MTGAETPDDRLLAASRGDVEAFAAFYRDHAESVLGYFASRVSSSEAAADLMAETFAALLLAVKRYRPAHDGSAIALLFTIAHSKLVDGYRRGEVSSRARERLGLERPELGEDDIERVSELADAEASRSRVLALLADLPEDQRGALIERVVNERDYREIAIASSCSEAVARKRVSRALGTLRTRLAGGRP